VHDRFGRLIDYLRISVTDRCNLRCEYCVPAGGISLLAADRILTFQEICEVASAAVRLGVRKIRLTGGEPLVREGVIDLVAMLAQIPDVEELCLTTNGILLATYAEPLARAGLTRVNVSLDAVDPQAFADITRGGDVSMVFKGIDAAVSAGLTPLKLNCVVHSSSHEPHALAVTEYALSKGLQVRFIRRMNLQNGSFWVVEGGRGGDCASCNRLRLTADGRIKPCLFSDIAFSVKSLGPETALRRAISEKPRAGSICHEHAFCAVGG